MLYENVNWEDLPHRQRVRDGFNDNETFKLRQERKS